MATTEYYTWIGKSLIVNWDERYTFFGKDLNPNVPSWPSTWDKDTTSASWETSYDLSWFQVWNEVCCCLFTFYNDDEDNSVTVNWRLEFQLRVWWSWYLPPDWWVSTDSIRLGAGSRRCQYYYAWVDSDEIRPWVSQYRFHIEWSSTDWSSGTINLPFSISNLSFDTSLHSSWYLWVEWENLCYTDWTRNYGARWYKHIIHHDSYTGWSGDPWYIWIRSGSSWYIYYTDAYGTVRRTHYASQRYGGSKSWSPWYIYVSNGDYTEWYWYLCFVDWDWTLRRLWNGEP